MSLSKWANESTRPLFPYLVLALALASGPFSHFKWMNE